MFVHVHARTTRSLCDITWWLGRARRGAWRSGACAGTSIRFPAHAHARQVGRYLLLHSSHDFNIPEPCPYRKSAVARTIMEGQPGRSVFVGHTRRFVRASRVTQCAHVRWW